MKYYIPTMFIRNNYNIDDIIEEQPLANEDEKQKLLDDKQKLLDDKQKLLDDKQKLLDDKQKLLDEIKIKGYKWNAETKTLEKLI